MLAEIAHRERRASIGARADEIAAFAARLSASVVMAGTLREQLVELQRRLGSELFTIQALARKLQELTR